MFGKPKKDITLKIAGMHCEHCAANLERALKETEGVKKASVSFVAATAQITFDESKVDEAKLAAVVKETGYQVV